MHAPTQWCIAVGSLQNPTLLGRAWKPAPTGFVRCRSCCAKSDPTRARNARPYAVVYRHWFFAESNLARAGVETRPYRVCALPFVLCKIGPYSGAQCTPLRSGVSPLVLCRIQPRSGGRGNPPLQGLCVAVRVVQNRTLLGRAMHAPTGLCVFVFSKTKSPDRQRNAVCRGNVYFC